VLIKGDNFTCYGQDFHMEVKMSDWIQSRARQVAEIDATNESRFPYRLLPCSRCSRDAVDIECQRD
jgi:hypothetical protein